MMRRHHFLCILFFAATVTGVWSIHPPHPGDDPFMLYRRGRRPIQDHINYLLYMPTFNPAFTGMGNPHLFIFTDMRYPAQSNFPLMICTGYDQPLKDTRRGSSIGYWAGYERNGKRWGMRHILNYSYHYQRNADLGFRIGAGVGYDYTEYSLQDATFGDMIDERYGFVYTTQEKFTGQLYRPGLILNGGVSVYFFRTTVNLSVSNTLVFTTGLNQPADRVQAFTTYSGSCLYDLRLTRKMDFFPSFEFNINSLNRYSLEGGAYIYRRSKGGFIFGASYNSLQYVSAIAGWGYNDIVRLVTKTYFPVSSLSQAYPVSGFMVQLHITLRSMEPVKKSKPVL